MNMKQFDAAITAAFKIGRTPIVHGLHGIGKSSKVRQWCKKNGYKMKDVRLGQMADSGDLVGMPKFTMDAKGNEVTTFVFPDWFPREENTIVHFDEFNRAPKDISQGVFETILDLSLKGIPFPKNCHVICSVNPATDDYVVMDFDDAAMQDRMVHIKLNPTAPEFFEYMETKFDKNAPALAFLKDDPKMLEDGGLASFNLDFVKPSRRSWEAVLALEEVFEKGEIEGFDDNIFAEMVQGIVGGTAQAAYTNHKKTNVSSIKAEDVLKDYDKLVKANLEKAKKKGRTDLIGNLVNDLGTLLEGMKGLKKGEAAGITALVQDLPPESAYTLATIMTSKASVSCSNVEGLPDGGLLESDDFCNMFLKIKKARDEGKAAIEEAAKAPKGKKKKVADEL